MSVGRVAGIFRYPVKSMRGERLERAPLGERGVVGDRAWAVRDEINGGIRGAKKLARLMECSARYTQEPPTEGSGAAEITLPDGAKLSSGDADAAARVSAAIGHEVTLWPLVPASQLEHYRRGAPSHADMETELRSIFAREADEPLPDLGLFPPEILQYESPPGTYFDAFPLLVVTDRSLASMQRRAPGSRFDVRRFRPNLLLEAEGDDDFPEQAWHDRKLQVGGATLRVTVECPRCVMVTHAQDDLPKDPKVMRALVREAGGNLGVYARVETPGPVAVGDAAQLV
ncbi:MAG: MOSC domain-containing protein [Myxococcota bacterium]